MAKEKTDTINVTKVTLSTGKVVLLREMKIRHTKLAAQAAGKRAGDNKALLAIEMQEELVRMLIAQVDDQPVPAVASLDDLFTVPEYGQLLKVVGAMSGDDQGEPQVTMSTTGGQ